jgi:RNA polymerase sigma-70 factor (ECF subfamily)
MGTDKGMRQDMTPSLEQTLRTALRAGRAAWPDVQVDEAAGVEYLAKRLPEGEPPADALASMHVTDLYLACACSRGDPRALAAFETHFLSAVASFVGQIDKSDSFADEVRQQLREKLFVCAPGDVPKIAEYTGRGPLGGWLRVASVRAALNLRRGNKTVVDPDDAGPALVSPTPDPEIDYLKTRYGHALREALQATLAALPADERNVLRMHYIDGLNIDEIGGAYRVHRSTVARWLSSARDRILEETKKALQGKLQLGHGEVESMIGLVQSQLDVSIYRFLGRPGA